MSDTYAPWYLEPDVDDAGLKLWTAAMRELDGQGAEKRTIAQDALTLYYGNARHRIGQEPRAPEGGLGLVDIIGRLLEPTAQNVVQMCVDTMVSLTTRNKVRPFFLTEAGDEDEKARAQGMMRAVEGINHAEGMYGWLGKMTAKSGYLWDGGFVKTICDYTRNKITKTRIFPWEWLVPLRAAKYGRPNEGYHVQAVDRYQLLEDFGYDENEDGERMENDLYERIMHAKSVPKEFIDEARSDGLATDKVIVVDGYHLASGFVDLDDTASFGISSETGELDGDWPWKETKHDGRRMLMIEGCVLVSEPYAYSEMPVAEFFPMENPEGTYGSRGLPETLAGGQLANERYSRRIDKIIDIHGKPTLVVNSRSKINKAKISNDTAAILTVDGPPSQAIQHIPAPPVPAELFSQREKIVANMKEQVGLSPTSLYGEKPPGVDHAPGMEHLLDEQNMRHFEPFEAWEQFFLKDARLTIEACRMMALRDPDFEIMWGDDKELKAIKWREVELSRKRFIMKEWPANLLPQTPAMKMKRLAEMAQMAPEMRAQIVTMLAEDYPDIAGLVGDTNAAAKNIAKKLDAIAREGYSERFIPHPYINLALAKQLAAERINKLEADGNETAMEGVIKFWEACDQIEKAQQAGAVAAAQGRSGAGLPEGMKESVTPGGATPGQDQAPPAPPGQMMQ